MSDFDLGSMQVTCGGLDSFLSENADLVAPPAGTSKVAGAGPAPGPPGRVKVASLAQLSGFIRTAEDTLIHKSDRDLWALRKDGSGEFYIERLFDDQGAPLKG